MIWGRVLGVRECFCDNSLSLFGEGFLVKYSNHRKRMYIEFFPPFKFKDGFCDLRHRNYFFLLFYSFFPLNVLPLIGEHSLPQKTLR